MPDARISTQAVVAWLRGGGLSAVARSVSVFVAVLAVGLIISSFVWPDPAAPQTYSGPLPSGAPRALVIPERGVHANVVPIDADGNGLLEPPSDFREVGWWRASGLASSSTMPMIVGHTVHTGDGAMDLVPDLPPNSEIDIDTDKQVLVYKLTYKQTMTKAEFQQRQSSLLVPGPDNLLLITCTGYDARTDDYTGNVLVYAQLISAHPLKK